MRAPSYNVRGTTTMSFSLTEEAAARPRLTIHAAEVFHAHAEEIADACAAAERAQVVLARVDGFLTFTGVLAVPRAQLTLYARGDSGGWTLVFSPGADIDEVRARCMELARSAFKRWEALRRWESRHPV